MLRKLMMTLACVSSLRAFSQSSSQLKKLHPICKIDTLERDEWISAAQKHNSRMMQYFQPLGHDLKDVSAHHPIFNFMFHYYGISLNSLLRYSPGPNVELKDVDGRDVAGGNKLLSNRYMIKRSTTNRLHRFNVHYDPTCIPNAKIAPLKVIRKIMVETASRKPNLHCFGMHEWAMLYDEKDENRISRHQSLPLRVSSQTINKTVASGALRCTHFDAFRFFSPSALPMNIEQLKRETQVHFEQPGCVHATMDLFKWATKLFPLVDSELLSDAFALALRARCVDMRASPYDLRSYSGYLGCDHSPIKVETVEGRTEYQKQQMELLRESSPIRRRLIDAYTYVLDKIDTGDSLT